LLFSSSSLKTHNISSVMQSQTQQQQRFVGSYVQRDQYGQHGARPNAPANVTSSPNRWGGPVALVFICVLIAASIYLAFRQITNTRTNTGTNTGTSTGTSTGASTGTGTMNAPPATPTLAPTFPFTMNCLTGQIYVSISPVANALSYRVTASPSGVSAVGTSSSPILLSGLDVEIAQTITYQAINAFGASAASPGATATAYMSIPANWLTSWNTAKNDSGISITWTPLAGPYGNVTYSGYAYAMADTTISIKYPWEGNVGSGRFTLGEGGYYYIVMAAQNQNNPTSPVQCTLPAPVYY